MGKSEVICKIASIRENFVVRILRSKYAPCTENKLIKLERVVCDILHVSPNSGIIVTQQFRLIILSTTLTACVVGGGGYRACLLVDYVRWYSTQCVYLLSPQELDTVSGL